MSLALRNACLGIIELAHPDARFSINEDYRQALNKTGIKRRQTSELEYKKETRLWAFLFKVRVSRCMWILFLDAAELTLYERVFILGERFVFVVSTLINTHTHTCKTVNNNPIAAVGGNKRTTVRWAVFSLFDVCVAGDLYIGEADSQSWQSQTVLCSWSLAGSQHLHAGW